MSNEQSGLLWQSITEALAHFPIALFSSVMGIIGLGLAWRAAAPVFALSSFVGEAIVAVSVFVYAAILICYGLKMACHPAAVKHEFLHPESVNFFPTFSIGTMLLASGVMPYAPQLAHMFWSVGAVITLVLTLVIVGRWLTHQNDVKHVNPTWFLAVVGNIVAPIAAVPLGHDELGWMFFGIGILFWIPLFTIVLYRMIFHGLLPSRLLPTMMILVGPPAVGFIAYVGLVGEIDGFARVLLYGAGFITLLIASIARAFVGIRFSASWWAFTFPLDAFTLAILHYYEQSGEQALGIAAAIALIVSSVVVLIVSACTVGALVRGTLLKPNTQRLTDGKPGDNGAGDETRLL